MFIVAFSATGARAQSTMTDNQVIELVMKEREAGTSPSQIVTKLMQSGVTIQQIRRVRDRYTQQMKQRGLGNVADEAVADTESRLRTNNASKDDDQKLVDKNTNMRTIGTRQVRKTKDGKIDETDPDFLSMSEEIGAMMPTDSIAWLEQLLEERDKEKQKVFGRDIFNNTELSFEPAMNIATPQNYRLGPGDAVIIDIYGASQKSIQSTVSPDGEVVIEGYGPIEVSGLTVSEANSRVNARLKSRYSSSQIKLSLGQTRTITVNVMGEVVVPGTYTLSAFASVFHALYMAGGTNDIGTLRAIKVYRHSKLVSTVDIYDYILNGKLTGNCRLADGDVIVVGPYDCLVNVTGKVKRPMFYEMKTSESVQTVLGYAGGFTGDAYTKSVRLVRKTGREYSVYNVEEFDMASFHLADGDSLSVDSIIPRFSNMAEVRGAVFHPGMYQVGGNINSVRSLIEHAEGLTEEAFTARAVMHRMKSDRSLEVLSVDVEGIMAGTVADIPLRENDVLFIPTKSEMQVDRTITIHGEVRYPGIYKYAENETVEDFVLQAGGLTDAASTVKVDVARRVTNPKALSADSIISQTFTLALKDGFVVDGEQGFTLMPFDEVYIRRSPAYSEQKNVKVEGNVMFSGTYTLASKNERLSELVKKAGGLNDKAYAAGARLERTLNDQERIRLESLKKLAKQQASSTDSVDLDKIDFGSTYYVGIELDKAIANPGSDADLVLREGDRLIVPEYNGTVKISGDVMFPNTVLYENGKHASYYINQAGGWGNTAKKSHTYVVYMNGTVSKLGHGTKILPGCEIVVPSKPENKKKTLAEIMSTASMSASFASMLLTMYNILF